MLAEETVRYNKQFIKGCEKALAASEFKIDCCTLLLFFNYLFFDTLFFTLLKILGGGGGRGSSPPLPLPLLRTRLTVWLYIPAAYLE